MTTTQRCSASYRAAQEGTNVSLTAEGSCPTTGYTVQLQRSPAAIVPPEFSLICTPPDGVAGDIVTPFSVTVHFESQELLKELWKTATGGTR